MVFKQEYLYFLAGIALLVVAVMSWRDKKNPRRFTTGLFWAIYGLIFLVGDWTTSLFSNMTIENPKQVINIIIGVLVVAMALLAGFGGMRLGSYSQLTDEQRSESAKCLGNKLFIPALAIPLGTVIGVLLFNNKELVTLVFGQGNHSTLITLFSMTAGCAIGLGIAMFLTKEKIGQPLQESRRLLDSIGWAFILPQILATLGLLFNDAGVGKGISFLTEHYINVENRFVAVMIFALGMALLTMVMGNAFAAFPIIAAGVGIPVLLVQHGGNPAVMAAIGMFSGYCGTLMTPMAANYNLVPAALLNLPNRYAVIKAQIPTALSLLVANIFLLYFLLFL